METEYKEIYSNRAIPPGEHITEILEFRNMSQKELAKRMGRSPSKLNSIIKGRLAITDETAFQLENVLNIKAKFWLNLQNNYDLNLAYIDELERIEKEQSKFLGKIDLKNLVKLGILEEYIDKRILIKELLKFLSINSLEVLPDIQSVVFRSSGKAKFYPEVVAVWLQWCKNASQNIDLPQFQKSKLINSLDNLRILTNSKLEEVMPELKNILNSAGVGLVLTPMIKNCQVNGAAYWQNNTPVIALNDRSKKNDIFWFTLFHEIAHVILHLNKKNNIFVDNGYDDNDIEREANKFAQDNLIPSKLYLELSEKIQKNQSENTIKFYSEEIGIDSGILVGRLQRDGFLDNDRLNSLKSNFLIENMIF